MLLISCLASLTAETFSRFASWTSLKGLASLDLDRHGCTRDAEQ